ncbi:MAG: spore coat protein [Bacillota bacterium]|nr:spore coat protein [Bacillota bacterium]
MPQLNDRDILADCLKDCKWASSTYHTAILESSTDQVRNTFFRLHNDLTNAAKSCFDLMHQRGWYPVEPARPGAQAQMQQQPQQQTYQEGYQGYQAGMGQATYGAPNVSQPRW